MGLWDKMKGVFGRIKDGIKGAFNWLKKNKDTVKKAIDTGIDIIAPQDKREQYHGYVDKGEGILDKVTGLVGRPR